RERGILEPARRARVRPAAIPERLLATARFGEWGAEMMDWWNPCARSFGEVMGKRGKKARAPKNSIYGIIERDGEGKFVASTHALKKGVTASAIGHTADKAHPAVPGRSICSMRVACAGDQRRAGG